MSIQTRSSLWMLVLLAACCISAPGDLKTVGGTVSGLAGTGLVLQLNGQNDLAISANATTFQFTASAVQGAHYSVTVFAEPAGVTCTVANGIDTVGGTDISDVTVTCSSSAYLVGGTVKGLVGSGLVLQLNGQNVLSVNSNGAFSFPTQVASGAIYTVSVAIQPTYPSQICDVTNASAQMGTADVTNVEVDCGSLTPAAPSPGTFMWQSSQTSFAGSSCQGAIVIAVGDRATCYGGADGALRCAGAVYQTTYGTRFVNAGQSNIGQILISPTFNSSTGNAMCVRRTDGTVWCIGDSNDWGQFGTGASGPSASFVQWGASIGSLAHIGTGTWDQICAVAMNGSVWCSGYDFGLSPVVQDAGNAHTAFWINTFGEVQLDPANVYRASNGRTTCQVTAIGLSCQEQTASLGTTGQVVDGFSVDTTSGTQFCWLTTDGTVYCSQGGMGASRLFANGVVLALAGNLYTTSICAVYADGSLWCLGDNMGGKLGTGDTATLAQETQVQSAGSVKIGCP